MTPLAPLRHRDFRLLWIGLLVSNTGSWMQFVATGYLVDRLTLSPVYLGLLALAQAIPRLMFAPIGGVVADRVDRRTLLMWTNLMLAASALLLALLTATGRATVWHVILLGGLNSLLMSFDMPARHAMVPELVDEEEVLQAVTLNSVAFNGAGILGPSLGGVVIAWAGEAACFLVNALSYGAVVAAVLRMHVLAQASTSGSVSEDLVDALRTLREDGTLLGVLGAVAVLNFFGRPYFRLMPAFAREVLRADAAQLGLLQAAPGVGTVLSAWYVARSGGGPHRLLISSAVLFGLSVSLFALSASLWLCVGFLVAAGLFQSAALSAANTLLQTRVDPRMRGRAMGLYSVTAFGMFTLGTFPMGLLSAAIGISHALALGGVLTVLLVLVLGRGLATGNR
ncbi:MAG: MFS transporter [Armatimonadota bacterium]|nr:MFS transporter [Armatimonadota bacterium]MDR7438834.1 MFS transporter [Armatimonadota bacterium]MDR7563960.1 MFS transporter [Armatimonadota bacterium]MDR7568671.1 MFS transporter [Armatimonadota bacterium]MDR7602208.1 MFS transporter [Armatimonadota bacterium]